MEYTRHEDYERLIDDPDVSYEFDRLSANSAYVVLNRGIDMDIRESDIVPVDVDGNDIYRFTLYKDFDLRESSDERITRTDKVLMEEGYVVYDRSNTQLSFANIHRVNGDNYTYQIKYVHRGNDVGPGETGESTTAEFQPQLIVYVDGISLEVTMRLDKDMNIVQIYSDYIGTVNTQDKLLGSCPLGTSDSSVSTDGLEVKGSKDIDVMVALSYILSNELILLRRLGDLMIDLGYIGDYVIV